MLREMAEGKLDEESLENIMEEVQDHVEKEQSELNSICVVYSKADGILTRRPEVNVKLHKPTHEEAHLKDIAGWSDGKTISFNADVVSLLSEQDIPALNGLNYHELSHLLYTPRVGTELLKWVLENNLGIAFNYLEDCRYRDTANGSIPFYTPLLRSELHAIRC